MPDTGNSHSMEIKPARTLLNRRKKKLDTKPTLHTGVIRLKPMTLPEIGHTKLARKSELMV